MLPVTAVSFLAAAATRQGAPAASGCDASLWAHVYNPSRLTKLNDCIAVSGVVEESSADDDGDQHFLLKLDPGQKHLLTKKNKSKKSGDLVVEIVCANPVRLKKVKFACDGYVNRVRSPAVGSHVKVVGTYVVDTHNGWAEVHPASSVSLVRGR